MATLNVEITEPMKQYVDRQIASGGFKNESAVVRALFDVAILGQKRQEVDQMLLVAVDQIERGECSPWQPGESKKMLDEIIRQRNSNGQT